MATVSVRNIGATGLSLWHDMSDPCNELVSLVNVDGCVNCTGDRIRDFVLLSP